LAGLEVPLEPRAALRPQGESFARLTREEGAGARVVGWAARRLPLRVGSSRELADADTARFWAAAREVERELGMRLFVPAPPGGESDLTIRVATGVPGAAVTQASWAGNGDVMEAEILLRGASVLHDRRVVAHELVHALGFGHTTAWRSIVAPASAPATSWLTPEDVAWVQLVYRLRETQRRVGAAFGLDAALAALPP
ncbi:MAG TPA: hypothetical protein VEA99_12090, partial [Gemmatimonadaceae bacterium]|nr:hypothetical protein [Gemmatimonadaceae bacterium]